MRQEATKKSDADKYLSATGFQLFSWQETSTFQPAAQESVREIRDGEGKIILVTRLCISSAEPQW